MGVPGFFAWLLKNYKKKSNQVVSARAPSNKVDVLYLDANCLIHPQCFKVLSMYPDFKDQTILEDRMIDRSIKYIKHLYDLVKPKELFIAVDGVAPLAKMNQQRKRRYRSYDDQVIRDEIKKKHGVALTKHWSNTVITPGTEFMERLNTKLINFMKLNKDIKITYSSYHTPGEGEHKILQDIKTRALSNKNKIHPTHVVYGLDADLIFLTLASGQTNLYLLREEQLFGKSASNDLSKYVDPNAFDELFNFVSVDNLKICINNHISDLISAKHSHPGSGEYVNDFIFICYLLGNDFLPHLPSVNIRTNGLDFLIDSYIKVASYSRFSKNFIIFDKDKVAVSVNFSFLSELFKHISKSEEYYFRTVLPKHHERLANLKCPKLDACEAELWELDRMRLNRILEDDVIGLGVSDSQDWKVKYYDKYFGVNSSDINSDVVAKSVSEYLRGVVWVTKYYFESCPSWDWQYVYTHAPFVSDVSDWLIKNSQFNPAFEISSAPSPCVQLLSVLPPRCSEILPKMYQSLVTSEESDIIDMYPTEIKLDTLYKSMYFECIPYLPCVDMYRIKQSVSSLKLTKLETIRDKVLPNYVNY